VEGGRRLRNAPAYADGRVELQDLSAQRAVASVDWPAEGRILDYCAGGGGKALAIADRTDAEILAHDADPGRMADLPVRAARAGVTIRIVPPGEVAGLARSTRCCATCPAAAAAHGGAIPRPSGG
jgi:16S rRNA (cytosine967-C5)-methyltransferase